jgi:thiol-disulfide isomerase/thioredoxin
MRSAWAISLFAVLIGTGSAGADTDHAGHNHPPATPDTFLQKGEVVPPFRASGIDGQSREFDYPKGKATVLLFFLSSCPTCHKMLPEWNRAYERRPEGLNVVGVLLDREPPGFFATTPVLFPVVRSPGKEILGSYKVSKVPLTLRVGPGGKVEDIAVSIVDPIRLGEIFRP